MFCEDLCQSVMQLDALGSSALKQLLTIRNVETRVGILFQLPDDLFVGRRRLVEVDSLPAQCIDGKRVEIARVDAASAKRFDESHAIVVFVVADQISIGGDDA